METNCGVASVLKACRILHCFRSDGELLRLREIVERTGIRKTTAFRLLETLLEGDVLERSGPVHFRRKFKPLERSAVRIGFAAQTAASTFSRLVTESIHRAARAYGVELVEVDNRYSPKAALRNAEMLVRERVDLAVEFQTYENVAPIVAARFLHAGVPVIAVEIPHPGALYFGAHNYQAGLIGGRALGRWAKEHWESQVEEVLLLREKVAGSLPGARITGMLAGMRETIPEIPDAIVRTFDGKGAFQPSYDVVRRHLLSAIPHRILIAANNDPSALGALKALEECGWARHAAVISQNSIPEAREELRRPESRLIGSVAYFPERYGDLLLPLALSVLRGESAPPATFVKHRLVTPGNVDRIYSRDRLSEAECAVSQRLH